MNLCISAFVAAISTTAYTTMKSHLASTVSELACLDQLHSSGIDLLNTATRWNHSYKTTGKITLLKVHFVGRIT